MGRLHLGAVGAIHERWTSVDGRTLFGAQIAHETLITTLVESGVVEGATLFASSHDASITETERNHSAAAIAEAGPIASAAVRFRPLEELPDCARAARMMFLSAGKWSNRLGVTRAVANIDFGIVSIVYSAWWPDAIADYVAYAALARIQDVLVVTSSASERVMAEVWTWCEDVGVIGRRPRTVRIPLTLPLHSIEHTDRDLARQLLRLSPLARIVLFVGRLSEGYKADLAPVVEVIARLRDAWPPTIAILAGHSEGGYGTKLRGIAALAGVGDRVLVIEDPPDSVKHLAYSAADVFISPVNSIQESFGIALLEAMAHGLPVVASDWSGYRDIVVDGETGFLVPTEWDDRRAHALSSTTWCDATSAVPRILARATAVNSGQLGRALSKLLDDPALRVRMGTAGRQRQETEFGVGAISRAFGELFEEQQSRWQMATETQRPLSLTTVFGHYATGRSTILPDALLPRDSPGDLH